MDFKVLQRLTVSVYRGQRVRARDRFINALPSRLFLVVLFCSFWAPSLKTGSSRDTKLTLSVVWLVHCDSTFKLTSASLAKSLSE